MHTFLLDLWQDLREKRLWPVAVLLAVATAAVPFTLLKKQAPAPAPTPTTAAPNQNAATTLPTVTLADAANKLPSNLESFDRRNPFKPLKDLDKTADASKSGGSSSGSPSSSGSGSSGSSGSGSGSGSGTGSGSSGSGSGSGTGSGAGTAAGTTTTYFTYRADLKFGKPGHEKTIKQAQKFSLLGDDKAPAAMYMGITDDTKYAVFAIDTSTFTTQGEGDCKPSDDDCQFVYLQVDDDKNETTITSVDGSKTYNLKLLSIKRVKLDKNNVESKPAENAKPNSKNAGKPVKVLPQSLFDVLSKRG